MTYRSVATWSVACAAIGTGAWLVFGNGLEKRRAERFLRNESCSGDLILTMGAGDVDSVGRALL